MIKQTFVENFKEMSGCLYLERLKKLVKTSQLREKIES